MPIDLTKFILCILILFYGCDDSCYLLTSNCQDNVSVEYDCIDSQNNLYTMACADEYSYHSVSIELKDTATNTLIFDYYDYTYSDYTHEFRFCLREERSYLMSMDFGNSYNDVVCNIRDENNEVKRTFSFREDYNGTFAIY